MVYPTWYTEMSGPDCAWYCFPMLWTGLFLWVTHRVEIVQKIRIPPVFTCREVNLHWLNSAPGCQLQSRPMERLPCTCTQKDSVGIRQSLTDETVESSKRGPGNSGFKSLFLSWTPDDTWELFVVAWFWHPLRACSRQGFIGLWSQPVMIMRALVRLGHLDYLP